MSIESIEEALASMPILLTPEEYLNDDTIASWRHLGLSATSSETDVKRIAGIYSKACEQLPQPVVCMALDWTLRYARNQLAAENDPDTAETPRGCCIGDDPWCSDDAAHNRCHQCRKPLGDATERCRSCGTAIAPF